MVVEWKWVRSVFGGRERYGVARAIDGRRAGANRDAKPHARTLVERQASRWRAEGYGVTHRGFSASAVRRVRSCLRTAIEVSLSLWMRPRTSKNSTAAAATATQTGRCEASRGSEGR